MSQVVAAMSVTESQITQDRQALQGAGVAGHLNIGVIVIGGTAPGNTPTSADIDVGVMSADVSVMLVYYADIALSRHNSTASQQLGMYLCWVPDIAGHSWS